METFEDTSWLNSSATRLEIGWTVEEPEIVIVPLRFSFEVAPPPPVEPAFPQRRTLSIDGERLSAPG